MIISDRDMTPEQLKDIQEQVSLDEATIPAPPIQSREELRALEQAKLPSFASYLAQQNRKNWKPHPSNMQRHSKEK